MRRSKNDAEKTKQLLVQAACEVFYREGVARATLEQIAREAGLTRGALYWHFNNKVDILDELFQWIMPNVDVLQLHNGHLVIGFSQPLFLHIAQKHHDDTKQMAAQ